MSTDSARSVRRRAAVIKSAIAIAVLLVAAACSPDATPAPSTSSAAEVRVELGIYSGRSDPTWTLTDEEVRALDSTLAGLPEARGIPPVGGLGYHGFTMVRSDLITLVAYLGSVAPPGDGARTYKGDPERLVERLLLDSGRAHLTDAEIAEVERSFGVVP